MKRKPTEPRDLSGGSVYRIVSLEPRPFSGIRIPIGAVVILDDWSAFEFVRAKSLPVGYLTQQEIACAELAQDACEKSPAAIASGIENIGPYVRVADGFFGVPLSVKNPPAWVRKHVLP